MFPEKGSKTGPGARTPGTRKKKGVHMSPNMILYALAVILAAASVLTTMRASVKEAKAAYRKEHYGEDYVPPKHPRRPAAVLFAAALVLFVAGGAFRIIPTGYTGVRTTFGIIDQESAMPGMNLTVPMVQKISLVNNKQQDIRFDEQIWSETKEQTPVYMQGVSVTYQIVPESSAWIYANVENWVEELVDYDLVSSALKAASRKLEADDVTNRAEIEPDSEKALQKAVDEKYGENRVIIKNIVINNMDFDESYNAAIAKKSEAMQKQQEQAITNKTNEDRAASEAEQARQRAQGDADAELIRANAKAQANKIVSESITAMTQRQDAIDKWDGTLPKAAGDGVSFGILDVAGVTVATAADGN